MVPSTKLNRYLRLLGFIEAASLLALMLVAMPMKYYWGNPDPVRWVGSIHGALFLAFVFSAAGVASEESWPRRRLILSWVAATLPFGPFILDGKIFPREE